MQLSALWICCAVLYLILISIKSAWLGNLEQILYQIKYIEPSF